MTRQSGAVGIDVGAHTVRLVRLSGAGGRIAVTAAAQAPAVPGSHEPGDQLRANLDVVRSLLDKSKTRDRRAVLSIPLTAARIKNFRLPCMPETELAQAVRFEALKRFGADEDEVEIRYYNAGRVSAERGDQFELIVFAVRSDVIRSQLEAMDELKLRVGALELSPSASFRPFEQFLHRAEDADQVNAFLDIGYRGSRIVVTRGPDIAFLKTFDTGVSKFEASIARELSLDGAEAAALYESIAVGGGDDHETPAADVEDKRIAVLDAIGPDIEHLAKELGLCFRYFSVTFRGARCESVTCVGGGARHGVVLERLGQALALPVRTGHPMRHLSADRAFAGTDRRSGQPEWATAVGLAMYLAADADGPVRSATESAVA